MKPSSKRAPSLVSMATVVMMTVLAFCSPVAEGDIMGSGLSERGETLAKIIPALYIRRRKGQLFPNQSSKKVIFL